MATEVEWETISEGSAVTLQRSRTPTGWLVREVRDVAFLADRMVERGYSWTSSITFVPDLTGDWLK